MDLAKFVECYSPADLERISFRSNGKNGPDLLDENSGFRIQVFRALKDGLSASDTLIRDLYDAESQWSAAAWCVRHEITAFLAGELLRRGGAENVRHFLNCIRRGQDFYLSSLCFQITPSERAAAVTDMELVLATEPEKPVGWRGVIEGIKQRGQLK